MQVRFWGVRGSVPWATIETIRHGCNTPCVEVIDQASGGRLVLDAGSGLVGLGKTLDHAPVTILLSHYHWDHLQGLPFFEPLYRRGASTTLWGPSLPLYDEAWLETMFRPPFFAVPHNRLPSPPVVRLIECGSTAIASFGVRAMQLNHPGGAYAYRISHAGTDLVYATDHEHGDKGIDRRFMEFVAGADAVVFDAHFTPDEISRHRGWGHSSWLHAAEDASAAGVGRLFLFHHKPGRTDRELTAIANEARKVFPNTEAAGEGAVFDL